MQVFFNLSTRMYYGVELDLFFLLFRTSRRQTNLFLTRILHLSSIFVSAGDENTNNFIIPVNLRVLKVFHR